MSQLQLNMSDPHPSYYNTNGLTGAYLAEKVSSAKTLERIIYEIFKKFPDVDYIRDEICEKLPESCAVSVGARMTTLMKAGLLIKTNTRRQGHLYGATQYAYKLK